jgi:type IV pilus assembly protein PilV
MTGSDKRAQDGMTLIEVLVAVLILGVGLLGAASIQLNALKYTDSSLMTSQASFIAYDMLDRIRASYSSTSGADYTKPPPASGNLDNVRVQDLYDFNTNIVAFGGPTATGSITVNQQVFTITINWDDSRAVGAANPAQGSTPQRTFVLTSRVAVDPPVSP